MPKCEYNDMEPIFAAGEIWVAGYERYWFQKAWNVLDSQNLTSYETRAEYFDVLLRAVGLTKAYLQFCGMAFDETSELDYYAQDFTEYLSSLELGQLVQKYVCSDDIFEEEGDAFEALSSAACYRTMKELGKVMMPGEVFAWMHCTADDSLALDAVSSYESFAEYVSRYGDVILNDAGSWGAQEAFNYILDMMTL